MIYLDARDVAQALEVSPATAHRVMAACGQQGRPAWITGEALADYIRRTRRSYQSTPAEREYAAERRDGLRAAGLCLNGAKHGKATDGVLCRRCKNRKA